MAHRKLWARSSSRRLLIGQALGLAAVLAAALAVTGCTPAPAGTASHGAHGRPLIHLQTEQLLSFAAIDPPSTAGKIRVIAVGGGLTSATAS